MSNRLLVVDNPRFIEVSESGEVYVNGVIRHQYLRRGYPTVKISQKAYRVHRLIAEAFVPNPNNLPFVNHKNGVKTDNRAENLEWCTQRQNVHHALRTGLHPKPETPIVAFSTRTGHSYSFESQASASRVTEVAQSNINKCLAGLRKTAGGFTWEYAL